MATSSFLLLLATLHLLLLANAERWASGAANGRREGRGRVGRERGRLSRLFSRPPSKPDVRLSPHPALQFPLFPSPGSTPWPGIMFRIVSALRISRTFASL